MFLTNEGALLAAVMSVVMLAVLALLNRRRISRTG